MHTETKNIVIKTTSNKIGDRIFHRILSSNQRSPKVDFKLNIKSFDPYGWIGWLGFYGISTFVGYSMPNPFL